MGQPERHPRGLYVLFFTEMWERFGFYTMGAIFTKYLRNQEQGFGWVDSDATGLNANYLMFVYASPLVGGWIADKKLGYRNSVLIGGLIFMAGYLLFTLPSLWAVYAGLTFLVVGNGFFKPNVSAMVGHLYTDGSALKDRAYNIFYMGINVGALLAPVVAEFMVGHFGYRPAYSVAAAGMICSVATLWYFKHLVEPSESVPHHSGEPSEAANPPRRRLIDDVPDSTRIGALVVIFLSVIVFWMVFHQNSSTLTYWADENTDWKVSGIISNAINPFWVVTLSLPLVYFWQWLNRKGLEPSTPTKMVLGMVLTGLMFFFMYLAAKTGEATVPEDAVGMDRYIYKVSPVWLIAGYFILTLGELMLSPMGLSLVSKVAPAHMRGLMMGGWFLATAIGNKLTMIGKLWYVWPHSTFFLVLGGMAIGMAVILLLLLRPLKKAMPGV